MMTENGLKSETGSIAISWSLFETPRAVSSLDKHFMRFLVSSKDMNLHNRRLSIDIFGTNLGSTS